MSMLMAKIQSEKLADIDIDVQPYVRVRPGERIRVQSVPEGETRTVQSEKDLTDINNIVQRYQRTGFLPPPTMQPQYGDVTALNRPLIELVTDAAEITAKADAFFKDYQPAQAPSLTDQPSSGEAKAEPPPSA